MKGSIRRGVPGDTESAGRAQVAGSSFCTMEAIVSDTVAVARSTPKRTKGDKEQGNKSYEA